MYFYYNYFLNFIHCIIKFAIPLNYFKNLHDKIMNYNFYYFILNLVSNFFNFSAMTHNNYWFLSLFLLILLLFHYIYLELLFLWDFNNPFLL